MKVNIRHILKEGYDIPLNSAQPWLVEILNTIVGPQAVEPDSIRGNIHLDNLSENINLSGSIDFTHYPACARCGTELTRREHIPLNANLVPMAALGGEEPRDAEEEVELTTEDLDFAFYKGEEIEVDPIVNDEIALALPYNYYCENTENCQTQHASLLQHHTAGAIDPRWLALKDVKVKS